jgi:GTPase SAR1 family protein
MNPENIANKLIEESVKATFETVLTIFQSIGLKINEKIKSNKAINSYVENYIHRHGQIKVLGMPKPISLQSIYINVDVNTTTYLSSYQSLAGLEVDFREKSNRRFHHHTSIRKQGIEIANEEMYLNILGAPGAGKSTFLKRIGLEALLPKCKSANQTEDKGYSSYDHYCLPILIELKRLKIEEVDLFEIIKEEFVSCDFPESDTFVLKCLEHGKLLILLDGLDEVPTEKIDSVITHIQDFSDKYKRNRFITSCRTAFYKTYFRSFVDVEISDFDNSQIIRFAHNWFSSKYDLELSTANNFTKLLFENRHEATLELARTPLLLTFLCMTYDSSTQLPANRSLLYKRALYILLERWAAEKRVHNDDIYQDFHADLEVEMLADIACSMYDAGKIFFSKDELTSCINSYIANILNIGKRINTSKVIEAIEVHQGLLVQRASDIYSFSHLTIQEYLTSYYFFSKSKVPELVNKHLFDSKWREVFLLLSGMSNTDYLLSLCSEKLHAFTLENPKIVNYFKWSQEVVIPSDDAEVNLSRRIFALSILLQYVRGPETNTGSIFNIHYETTASEVALRLNKDTQFYFYKNLNKERTFKSLENLRELNFLRINTSLFVDKINNEEDQPIDGIMGSRNRQNKRYLNLLIQCLGFDITQYKPGYVKMKPLVEYIEACELIIRCKEESMTITKDAWENVCNKLVNID